MDEKLLDNIRVRIDKKIKQRTGLRTEKDVAIYSFFCHNSDLKRGLVMSGDVTYDIYRYLEGTCSEPMKVLERAYNDAVGNHIDIPLNMEGSYYFRSPLSHKAEEIYGKYLIKFVKKDLVSRGKSGSGESYPLLTGYNYFNDNEFYIKTKSKNSSGRELKLPKESQNNQKLAI